MKRVVIIGNGKMAVDCAKILIDTPGVTPVLLVYDPDNPSWPEKTVRFCSERGIESLGRKNPNRRTTLECIRTAAPDFILSVSNYSILKRPLLDLPPGGVINFHNGPLPAYRGVHIPSWAIVNGETTHGITWHLCDEGIDTGDVVAERRFPVAADETAISLVFKCIAEGISLFAEVARSIGSGTFVATPQVGPSSYYSLKDVPNDGFVDFSWPFARFERFLRGLDFRPFPNPVAFPRARAAETEFIINRVSLHERGRGGAEPGRIVVADAQSLRVAIADAVVNVVEVMDNRQEPLDIGELVERYRLRAGHRFDARPKVNTTRAG